MNITTSDNKATAFRIYVSGYQSLKRGEKNKPPVPLDRTDLDLPWALSKNL